MPLNKRECKLIGQLNMVYEHTWKVWQESGGNEEYLLKMKLVKKICKNIEEQGRGFLKSNLKYKNAGDFLVENGELMNYDELLKGVTDTLLGPT